MAWGMALAIRPWLNRPIQAALAVHFQVARCRTVGEPTSAVKIVVGQLAEQARDVLRVNRPAGLGQLRQVIQAAGELSRSASESRGNARDRSCGSGAAGRADGLAHVRRDAQVRVARRPSACGLRSIWMIFASVG